MNLCQTFLLVRGHLWVVCSTRTSDGSVAMVNFTSWRPGCDESCVVLPGDHSFVVRRTVVAYQHARLVPPEMQAEVIRNPGMCPPRQPVSNELLLRILRGGLVSDLTPQKIQVIFRLTLQALGVEP